MKNKIIGIYQLITGIFGILLILTNSSKAIVNVEIRFTVFLGLVLFFALAFCGYALLKDYKNAVKYSIVAQAVQVLGLVYNGSQYLFTGSAFLSFIINTKSGLSFNYQLLPIAFNISKVAKDIPFQLNIFLIPLVFILMLVVKKIDF
jgi:hypothetical protein